MKKTEFRIQNPVVRSQNGRMERFQYSEFCILDSKFYLSGPSVFCGKRFSAKP